MLEPGDDTNSTETSISNDSLLSASCSTSNNEIYHDDENQLTTITNIVANPAKNVSIHIRMYTYMYTVNKQIKRDTYFYIPLVLRTNPNQDVRILTQLCLKNLIFDILRGVYKNEKYKFKRFF